MVESTVGAGSTFVVSWSPASAIATHPRPPRLTGERPRRASTADSLRRCEGHRATRALYLRPKSNGGAERRTQGPKSIAPKITAQTRPEELDRAARGPLRAATSGRQPSTSAARPIAITLRRCSPGFARAVLRPGCGLPVSARRMRARASFTSVSMPVPMLTGPVAVGSSASEVGAHDVADEHVVARLLAVAVDGRRPRSRAVAP